MKKLNLKLNIKNWNFKEFIAKIKEKPSKFIYSAFIVIFAAIFLCSTGFLVVYYINSNKQAQQNDHLASIVEQAQKEMGADNTIINPDGSLNIDPENPLLNNKNIYAEVTHPTTGETMAILKEYATVFLMNSDMVGWIKIPGTQVNYPIMQTPNEPEFYLKKDFYKEYARHGSIFAHGSANFQSLSTNITLYGHNMADGAMFAGLHAYEDPVFYEEHPYILFDTLTSHNIYKIIAVFYTTDIPLKGFMYHTYVDGDEEDFEYFISECKERSMYEISDTAVWGDRLLTLSTCDHDVVDAHGRFVVVAKKVSL